MAGRTTEIIGKDGQSIAVGYTWRSLDTAFAALKNDKLEELFFACVSDGTNNELKMAKCLYVLYVSALVLENEGKAPKECMSVEEFLDCLPESPTAVFAAWGQEMFPNGK